MSSIQLALLHRMLDNERATSTVSCLEPCYVLAVTLAANDIIWIAAANDVKGQVLLMLLTMSKIATKLLLLHKIWK